MLSFVFTSSLTQPDARSCHVISDMPPARIRRLECIKNQTARGEYLASTMALRRALFAFTGDDRAFMSFRYGDNGRPETAAAFVSLSHTDGLAVCAAANVSVGVDIERADRPLTPRLMETFPTIDHWLAMEACVKMTGEGLAGRNNYTLSGNAMLDKNGAPFARVTFIDRPPYRICVCAERESAVEIV